MGLGMGARMERGAVSGLLGERAGLLVRRRPEGLSVLLGPFFR